MRHVLFLEKDYLKVTTKAADNEVRTKLVYMILASSIVYLVYQMLSELTFDAFPWVTPRNLLNGSVTQSSRFSFAVRGW